MSRDQRIELAAHVWDNLSTAQKLQLLSMIAAGSLAVLSIGYALRDRLGAVELAELRARHAGELAKSQTAADSECLQLGLRPPDEGLLRFDEAPVSTLTMIEFAAINEQHRANSRNLTSINQRHGFEEHVSLRFTWTGFLTDVCPSRYNGVSYYKLSLRPELRKIATFQPNAYLVGSHYAAIAKALTPDQRITISGVLNDTGDLTQCRIVEVGEKQIEAR